MTFTTVVLNPPLATLEVAVLDADRLRRAFRRIAVPRWENGCGNWIAKMPRDTKGFHGRQRLPVRRRIAGLVTGPRAD